MGLLYTKFYMDFEQDEWRQESAEPLIFEAVSKVTLDIEDTSHKLYKVAFKKGAKLKVLRVVGKYRISWDDRDEA